MIKIYTKKNRTGRRLAVEMDWVEFQQGKDEWSLTGLYLGLVKGKNPVVRKQDNMWRWSGKGLMFK